MKKQEKKQVKELAPCHFCGKKVDAKEYLCAGCGVVTCGDGDCERDPLNPPMGKHHPMAHTVEM